MNRASKSHIPDVERDGHKGVEDDDGGEHLEERDLSRCVLEGVVVASIVLKPHSVHKLKYEGANQADQHTHHQEPQDLWGGGG